MWSLYQWFLKHLSGYFFLDFWACGAEMLLKAASALSRYISINTDKFYPSISEDLLTSAINYAKQITNISQQHIGIIIHARKSLLFENDTASRKKWNQNKFEVIRCRMRPSTEPKYVNWLDYTPWVYTKRQYDKGRIIELYIVNYNKNTWR